MTKAMRLFPGTMAAVLLALSTTAASAGAAGASAWQMPEAVPPLATGSIAVERSAREVAPGLLLYRLVLGVSSPADGFEVNAGFVRRPADAAPLVAALTAAGHASKLVASADGGATGYAIRLDRRFATAEEADAMATTLRGSAGLPAPSAALAVGFGRVFTAEDGGPTTGPFRISLLAVRPGFAGTLKAALATDIIPGRETTTALAQRIGALAAVNGGFFQLGSETGTAGGLAGLSVIDGRLVSEGVAQRPALVIETGGGQHNAVRLERRLTTEISVAVNGGPARRVDGSNRRPQVTVNCGRPVALETTVALHDAICRNPDAIVVYTADFGDKASADVTGPVTEVVVDAQGVATQVARGAGAAIPAGGQVLQGVGSGAAWLAETVAVGAKVAVARRLINGAGAEVALKPGTYALNGGPTLLADGVPVAFDHAIEGFGNADVAGYGFDRPNGNRANFFNGWYLRRNPRTAVGMAADGTVLLMVADGRAPRYAAGLSIPETALVMQHFGAVDAINLDGGGSSMMVVAGEALTRPSDTGNIERPDADALVIMK